MVAVCPLNGESVLGGIEDSRGEGVVPIDSDWLVGWLVGYFDGCQDYPLLMFFSCFFKGVGVCFVLAMADKMMALASIPSPHRSLKNKQTNKTKQTGTRKDFAAT